MKVAVLKERRAGETRVAATPETVKKLKGLGLDMTVESGAGNGAQVFDNDYIAAGATVSPDRAAMLRHDMRRYRQTQPGSLRFGGIKRFKHMLQML